jgi:hypothetical protein
MTRRIRSPRRYVNLVVHREYLSLGRTGSTSTTSCAANTRLPIARALPQPCHAPSCRSTSRRSVALALAVRPVTASRGVTTRRPDCTASTASGRSVSPLDFSSVGRTGSRRVSSHYVSWCDYSLSGLHRLYCAYAVHPDALSHHYTSRRPVALALAVLRSLRLAVRLLVVRIAPALLHPDAPSRHSTSRRSVAMALAVRLVTASRGVTTRRPDCTVPTAPMSCIWTRRITARLLIGRSHWLSPCIRSLCLAV